ncbi:MAG TPA: hypothetical protein DCZ11_00310 [Gammaproteobacteria bacterium]|nr:hypothetical protein [Gammaproteobacteria bacterium]MCH76869.1 hypothetical protein [Gammaproteobacteria bacterium]
MAETNWQIQGQYAENCSCKYLCPCIFTNSTALSIPATQEVGDHCIAVLCLNIESGRYGEVSLDGLSFIFIIKTPLVMSQGGWTAAAVIDSKADDAQRHALETIVRGEAGGPLSMMKPMIAQFAGIETGPIEFSLEDNKRSVKVPGLIEIGVEGYLSRRNNGEPFYIDNVGHPANSKLALGIATGSHAHVPGIDWDDTTGTNNGHFAPFSWSGSVQPTAYVFDRKAAS